MTKQINVATVVGTVTGSGNASVIVTAALMNNSPKTLSVAVLNHDVAATVAQAIRYALATDPDVSAAFLVGGAGANVQLTSEIDAANDTTLNVAIDNASCTGLTPAPTSTTTVQGVATITHGYCTLAEFKAYGLPKALNSAADDTVISLLIESASRKADYYSGRTFYAGSATVHYFDTPLANQTPPIGNYLTSPTNPADTILFDADLQALTSITNGDGTVLDPASYVLLPYSGPPYSGVRLRPSSGTMWNTNAGDPLAAIQVLGTWGAATSVPADIKEAVMSIIKEAYSRRFGENMTSKSIITTGGVIVTPEDISDGAMETFMAHRRVAFG
jgi:hypothetical protein